MHSGKILDWFWWNVKEKAKKKPRKKEREDKREKPNRAVCNGQKKLWRSVRRRDVGESNGQNYCRGSKERGERSRRGRRQGKKRKGHNTITLISVVNRGIFVIWLVFCSGKIIRWKKLGKAIESKGPACKVKGKFWTHMMKRYYHQVSRCLRFLFLPLVVSFNHENGH